MALSAEQEAHRLLLETRANALQALAALLSLGPLLDEDQVRAMGSERTDERALRSMTRCAHAQCRRRIRSVPTECCVM